MTPANPRELLEVALFEARRLLRLLRAMPAGSLGSAGSVTHYDRREAHIAAVASVCVDLEDAMKTAKAAMKEAAQ